MQQEARRKQPEQGPTACDSYLQAHGFGTIFWRKDAVMIDSVVSITNAAPTLIATRMVVSVVGALVKQAAATAVPRE